MATVGGIIGKALLHQDFPDEPEETDDRRFLSLLEADLKDLALRDGAMLQ